MKKVLFGIICIVVFTLNLPEQSFAETLSFETIDGRFFCETDRFDGTYTLCSKEQLSGTGLAQAGKYAPQFLETTKERICVEKGKEIDEKICNKISGLPSESIKTIPETRVTTETGSTNTGTIPLSAPISTGAAPVTLAVSTGVIATSTGVAVEQETQTLVGIVAEIQARVGKMSGNQIILLGVAATLSFVGIIVYYIIRRRRQKRLAVAASPVMRSSLPVNNGSGAPHRVVNRWVPAPPPPTIIQPEQPSSLFPPPAPPPPAGSPSEKEAPKPTGPTVPQPSSFLANHLGEL